MSVPREQTDEELLADLEQWARSMGRVPGQPAIRDRVGVGGGRATRLQQALRERMERTPRPVPGRVTDPGQRVGTGSVFPMFPGQHSRSSNPGQMASVADPDPNAARPIPEAPHVRSTVEDTVVLPAVRPDDGMSSQVSRAEGAVDPTPEQSDSAEAAPDVTRVADLAKEERVGRSDPGQSVDSRVATGAPQRVDPTRDVTRDEEAHDPAKRHRPGLSTWLFVLGSLVGLAVSVDTSWRFFGDKVGVTNMAERIAMFSGIEVLLIACGVAMFEGVRAPGGKPGPARWLAWALCAAAGYAAFVLSGPAIGLARVALGPVLAVLSFHFALGIEVRAQRGHRAGALGRVLAELRERLLSRVGLADDGRDALARTRDRAARRAAYLAQAKKAPFRESRLRRALRRANVAHEPQMRERMLAELAVLQHAEELKDLAQGSPWLADVAE